MLPRSLAFIDIETTGLRSTHDRIIEIGIVRVEDNKIVDTYHSLVNPEAYLPSEIELITGITAAELENAPTFRGIKKEILERLVDATFVAHNVRFDYGFLKNEFKREDISFTAKQLCTVKLSRALFPSQRRHNLDAIIERFAITCSNRHRALDDAQVLVSFYNKLQTMFSEEKLTEAVDRCFNKPSLPIKLHPSFLDTLPESPGVYLFYDGNNTPLYVGKSINIKDRVLSHFAADISSATEMNISQQIERIETIQTAGELGALVLESQLIKKMLPIYNKKSRIKRELIAIKKRLTKEGFENYYLDSVSIIKPDDIPSIVGLFSSRKQAKTFLSEIAKQYTLCEKLLGLESFDKLGTKACFSYRLGKCKGACLGKEKAPIYNARCSIAFTKSKILPWPFSQAISIEEKEINGKQEYFLVDNWCLVGHIVLDNEGNKNVQQETEILFDLDLYKIIRGYLKKPLSQQKITSIARQELFSLLHESF